MKISEMTTNQAADVLIRIAEPAANIMHDNETIAVLERLATGNDRPIEFIADNIVPVFNVILKSHRGDAFEIIAALSDKTVEDIGQQKMTDTILDIKNCWDGDLVDFFASLRK